MSKDYQAVITGGSSGIGAAFARYYCQTGYKTLLIGRREKELKNICDDINSTHPDTASYQIVNLNDRNEVSSLVATIQELHKLKVLINNAGYNVDGLFHKIDIAEHMDLCQVHMTTIVELTHCACPALLNNNGTIINIASLAAYMPTPMATLYGPTKAFVKSFSESLAAAYFKQKLSVIAVCPGFIRTDFHKKLGIEPGQFYKNKGMVRAYSPEDVVHKTMKDLRRGKSTSVVGWNYQLIRWLMRHLPEFAIQRIFRSVSGSRPNQ